VGLSLDDCLLPPLFHLSSHLLPALTRPFPLPRIAGARRRRARAGGYCEHGAVGRSCCGCSRSVWTRRTTASARRHPAQPPPPSLVSPLAACPSFSVRLARAKSPGGRRPARVVHPVHAWPHGHAGPCGLAHPGPSSLPFSFFPPPPGFSPGPAQFCTPERPRRFPPISSFKHFCFSDKTRGTQMLITPVLQTQIE
jgi:hypothetical protein